MDLIDKGMDACNASGILRSLHQGFMSHTNNMEFLDEWINMMNRLRMEANSRAGDPDLNISDIHLCVIGVS
jgi:hypothetical protein